MQANRYDRFEFKATRTDEGYLVDTPVVSRVGIQLYKNPDGSVRRELRPPEEVFDGDSLATFKGKPITDDHPSVPVTSQNAKALTVGLMQDVGVQDGTNVRVPIVVFDGSVVDKAIKGGKRELSVGYKVDLDETPGVWEGQEYDAVQRNIRVNHLAIVPKGRAGNARLNLDRSDAVFFNPQEDEMSDKLGRVRLDNGLEYQADQEVVVAIAQLRDDVATLTTAKTEVQRKLDTVTAERDALKADSLNADKVREDALKKAREELKHRAELEKVAEGLKLDCAGKTDRQVKELVIRAVRGDNADFSDKNDTYIDAAYDIAVAQKAASAMASQRTAMHGNPGTPGARADSGGSQAAYGTFMKTLGSDKKEA